jgi:hypothetical protein
VTTILLCLLGSLILSFLAGMRFATVLRRERENKRGGYLPIGPYDL